MEAIAELRAVVLHGDLIDRHPLLFATVLQLAAHLLAAGDGVRVGVELTGESDRLKAARYLSSMDSRSRFRNSVPTTPAPTSPRNATTPASAHHSRRCPERTHPDTADGETPTAPD